MKSIRNFLSINSSRVMSISSHGVLLQVAQLYLNSTRLLITIVVHHAKNTIA